jgi:hypothetical protein
MRKENEATLAELAKKHGQVVNFETKDGRLFAFRTPEMGEWERLQARILTGAEEVGPARREICQCTCVYAGGASDDAIPSTLHALFEKAPVVPSMITEQLRELATDAIQVTVKKG